MIGSITKLCLSLLLCTNGLSYSCEETQPTLCLKRRQTDLASEILNEINISCYTEYKAFGPSLIYNTCNFKLNYQLKHIKSSKPNLSEDAMIKFVP